MIVENEMQRLFFFVLFFVFQSSHGSPFCISPVLCNENERTAFFTGLTSLFVHPGRSFSAEAFLGVFTKAGHGKGGSGGDGLAPLRAVIDKAKITPQQALEFYRKSGVASALQSDPKSVIVANLSLRKDPQACKKEVKELLEAQKEKISFTALFLPFLHEMYQGREWCVGREEEIALLLPYLAILAREKDDVRAFQTFLKDDFFLDLSAKGLLEHPLQLLKTHFFVHLLSLMNLGDQAEFLMQYPRDILQHGLSVNDLLTWRNKMKVAHVAEGLLLPVKLSNPGMSVLLEKLAYLSFFSPPFSEDFLMQSDLWKVIKSKEADPYRLPIRSLLALGCDKPNDFLKSLPVIHGEVQAKLRDQKYGDTVRDYLSEVVVSIIRYNLDLFKDGLLARLSHPVLMKEFFSIFEGDLDRKTYKGESLSTYLVALKDQREGWCKEVAKNHPREEIPRNDLSGGKMKKIPKLEERLLSNLLDIMKEQMKPIVLLWIRQAIQDEKGAVEQRRTVGNQPRKRSRSWDERDRFS